MTSKASAPGDKAPTKGTAAGCDGGARAAPVRHRSCQRLDLTGRKYGRLTVIKRIGPDHRGRVSWRVRCDCGKKYPILADHIMRGVRQCLECAKQHSARPWARLKNGKYLCDLAKETGIPLNTLYQRWFRGWPDKRITEPRHHRGQSPSSPNLTRRRDGDSPSPRLSKSAVGGGR
jgi:hypothetical protein